MIQGFPVQEGYHRTFQAAAQMFDMLLAAIERKVEAAIEAAGTAITSTPIVELPPDVAAQHLAVPATPSRRPAPAEVPDTERPPPTPSAPPGRVASAFQPWPRPPPASIDEMVSTTTNTDASTAAVTGRGRQTIPSTPSKQTNARKRRSSPSPSADNAKARNSRPRKRQRREDDEGDDEEEWEGAWPWMRVALSLGLQLGGRRSVDRRLQQACPCCFGDIQGRGFEEYVPRSIFSMSLRTL